MSSHELYDPDLIKAVENFLRQEKEAASKKETEEKQTPLSMLREDLQAPILKAFADQERLDDFLHQVQKDTSMNVVSRKQAVVKSDELTNLAEHTAQTVLKHEVSDKTHEGFRMLWFPTSPFAAFDIRLGTNAVPDFFRAEFILFENYSSGNIRNDDKSLAEALGIDRKRPTGRLTIYSPIGAVTDPQTKSAMEYIVSTFPNASEIRQFTYTDYYFFGNRIGKVVYLPPILLSKRGIENEFNQSSGRALSEVTAGDLAIIKVGLLAIEHNLMS